MHKYRILSKKCKKVIFVPVKHFIQNMNLRLRKIVCCNVKEYLIALHTQMSSHSVYIH